MTEIEIRMKTKPNSLEIVLSANLQPGELSRPSRSGAGLSDPSIFPFLNLTWKGMPRKESESSPWAHQQTP